LISFVFIVTSTAWGSRRKNCHFRETLSKCPKGIYISSWSQW